MPLRFEKIITRKKRFLDLLLLADEQESMIDRYLERGEMFVAVTTDRSSPNASSRTKPTESERSRIWLYPSSINGKDTDDKCSNFWKRTTGIVTGRFSSAPGMFPAHSVFTNDADTFARTRSPASSPIITTTPSSKMAGNW